MGMASNRKWIHRAERVVNMRRRAGVPTADMLTWRRASKFYRALLYVLAQPIKVVKARLSPMKMLQNFFNRRQSRRLVAA